MSNGLVVARTTGRPASRCSSISIRAQGCTEPLSTLAASVAAASTASDDQPGRERGGATREGHARQRLADDLEELVERTLPGDVAVGDDAGLLQGGGDDRPARTTEQRAIEVEERSSGGHRGTLTLRHAGRPTRPVPRRPCTDLGQDAEEADPGGGSASTPSERELTGGEVVHAVLLGISVRMGADLSNASW
jgi:hypothetical protein